MFDTAIVIVAFGIVVLELLPWAFGQVRKAVEIMNGLKSEEEEICHNR